MAAHGYYASYEDDEDNGSHGGSGYSDNVFVIVDAEGRRLPLISHPSHRAHSTGYYAVETIERVRVPVVVAESRHVVSSKGMQPPTDYADTNDQRYTPPSPEYKYRNQGTVEPPKAYGYKIERQRSPPRLVVDCPEYKYPNNHGTDERQHSRSTLVGDRPEDKYSSNNNRGRVKPPKVHGPIKERGPSPPRPVADRPEDKYSSNNNRGRVEPPKVYGPIRERGPSPPRPVAEDKYSSNNNRGRVEPPKVYGPIRERGPSPPRPVAEDKYSSSNNRGRVEPPKVYGPLRERGPSPPRPVADRPEDKYSSNNNRGRVEPPKVYGPIRDRGPSPPRPVADRPQVVANGSGVTNSRKAWPSSGQVGNPPVTNPPTKKEPLKTYGPSVDSQPPKGPNFLPATAWRKNPAPNLTGQSGSTGYVDDNEDYYQRNYDWADLTIVNKDGGKESGNKGRTTTPTYISPLSGPTNDIGKVMEMLKESANSLCITATAQQPRTYTETSDNKEAARRYEDFKRSSKPFQRGNDYSRIIDSDEAARIYNGTRV